MTKYFTTGSTLVGQGYQKKLKISAEKPSNEELVSGAIPRSTDAILIARYYGAAVLPILKGVLC